MSKKNLPGHSERSQSALSRLLSIILEDRALVVKAAFFQILQAATFIPFTAAVGLFIDHVIQPHKPWPWIVGYALANLLWWPVHAFCTVRAYAKTQMIVRITLAKLRLMAVDSLQRLSINFFTRQGAGALSNKLTVDISRIETFLLTATNNLLVSCAVATGMVIYLFWLNYRLAWVSLVLMPLQLLIVRLMHRRLKALNARVQRMGEDFSERMVEFVAGMRLTKSFGNEELMANRLAATIENLRAAGYDASVGIRWMLMWLQMATQYMPVLIWSAGAFLYLHHQVTLGSLVVFAAQIGFIQTGLNTAIDTYGQWLPARPGAEALFEILDSNEIEEFTQAHKHISFTGEVIFDNVTFYYPGNQQTALRNIALEIPAGQRVGLVGETGAGKSTFLDLAIGFYRPSSGRIKWDGCELSEIGSMQLRRATAIMSQDAFLWNDTVRENIRFGRAEASDNEVEEAARRAHAHDFIMRLDNEYATRCGERGSRLSGGQRQRIALARIFLRNPRFIVLDEPTSALDVETEAHLQEDLNELCQGRTTFIVAHRLSTLRYVNRVLFFSRGRIIEDGPPAELLQNKNGNFYKFHELQSLTARPGSSQTLS